MRNSFELPQIPGVTYLYPFQILCIHNILGAQGYFHPAEALQDFPRHQIVLLPTGAGKSLCFTVPILLNKTLTVIVYPLLALMRDQYRRLKDSGIQAAILQGGQTKAQRQKIFDDIASGQVSLILTNPETLTTPRLLPHLNQWKIQHLVIDEAHCISQWGRSFRPHYRELGALGQTLKIPQITAFTATASSEILSDVQEDLFPGLEPHLIRGHPDRPNIHFSYHKVFSTPWAVISLLGRCPYPVLIFFGSRQGSEIGCQLLKDQFPEKEVRYYHAGREKSLKNKVEEWFFASKTGILCATNAYGMGVDKKNIRTVIHWEESYTPEGFIQETGRGGRDGNPAFSHLISSHNTSESVGKIYPIEDQCRREALLNHLDATVEICTGCDVCDPPSPLQLSPDRLFDILKNLSRRIVSLDLEIFFWGRGPGLLHDRSLMGLLGYGYYSHLNLSVIQGIFKDLKKSGKIGFYTWGPFKGTLWVKKISPPWAGSRG